MSRAEPRLLFEDYGLVLEEAPVHREEPRWWLTARPRPRREVEPLAHELDEPDRALAGEPLALRGGERSLEKGVEVECDEFGDAVGAGSA
jgi:hypothetical protein